VKIVLAGFNVDYETLKELKKDNKTNIALTPEVFPAAYARISRSPKPVKELRKIAKKEIEKARRTNRKIIFEMGHHSVAEHAVFNFDIMDISRLLTEELEKFRLCSYTEKSQRYIKLKGNYVIPPEIAKSRYIDRFVRLMDKGTKLYHELYKRIVNSEKKKIGRQPTKEETRNIRIKANEDARYVLGLSQKTQIGETINARNLELLLRRFASHNLEEARIFGEKIHALVKKIAPSVILFYEENPFDKKTYSSIKDFAKVKKSKIGEKEKCDVDLIDCTKNADSILVSSILHSISDISFTKAKQKAKNMSPKAKKDLVKKAFQHMELYDTVLREFEYIHLTYELVVSASCFAQLKRHRQATITSQRYNPHLGVTIPESINETGMAEKFKEFIKQTDNLFYRLNEEFPVVSQYVLTNAHRKRVLLSVNARELYHISRLREDKHAQWEIRNKTKKMLVLARQAMPITVLATGGKDNYPEVYKRIFGKYPRVIKPILPT